MAGLNEAQLYWDDQDPKNAGWWLRYRDDRGVEEGFSITAAQDATTEELAKAITEALDGNYYDGAITIIRGERRGFVTVECGVAIDWRLV